MLLCIGALPVAAREKDATPYGMGLIINVPFPEKEVTQAVQEIVQNGIIRGTKEYNKDEFINNATAVESTRVFPAWTGEGKVFYKVRFKALDPRNFKDSSDVGTLAVRYVVQPQGEKNTVLRIDAVFVEDFRKSVHLSNGSVESAEYKDIHDRLDAVELVKAQTEEAQKEKLEHETKSQQGAFTDVSAATASASVGAEPNPAPSSASTAGSIATEPTEVEGAGAKAVPQTLEEHVRDLRRQVQRLVKAPGAPLKSAPFHTASNLQSLSPGTEVLIVISTPYWLGVETREGQHGWMMRDDLEMLP